LPLKYVLFNNSASLKKFQFYQHSWGAAELQNISVLESSITRCTLVNNIVPVDKRRI